MKIFQSRRQFIKTSAFMGIGVSLGTSVFGKSSVFSVIPQAGKRVGIIGLDTSHSIAFTKSLNAEQPKPEFRGYRVVAAYPQGSKDIQSSVSRVPEYTETVKKYGVEIVNSISELLSKVDVVLLESNDGRVHLEQAIQVFKAKKPVFIDKPIAASYRDAKKIFELAAQYNVPVFSSSSLRYLSGVQEILNTGKIGRVLGADTYSPAHLESTHPDLFWYGIHGVEILFALMGIGCESVVRVHAQDADIAVGRWKDGRLGTFRGFRKGKSDYGGIAFGEKGNITLGRYGGYDPLLVKIVEFFDTRVAPFDYRQTLEICAFMEAADLSKKQNGREVKLSEITG